MYTRSLLRSTRTVSLIRFSKSISLIKSYHTTTVLNYFHNNNINDNEHNYIASESDAEGITNTDDLIPPETSKTKNTTVSASGYDFDDELNQQYDDWNEREPAAAASNSGSTIYEMKQFAGNVVGRTREALKGESRTSSHGTNSSESTQPPKRFVATSTKIKDQATKAASDAKEAIKKTAKAVGAEMFETKNQTEANAYAESSKANAKNVVDNAKEAVSDAYQTAKQAVSKGTQEVKNKANEYANTASKRASEAAGNIKRSTDNIQKTVTGTSTDPRTDNPTDEPRIHPRTDGGARPEPTPPRTADTF